VPSAGVTTAPLPTRAVSQKNIISANGVLQTARAPIALSAAIDAKVATVNVEPGQPVKRGETLATLESTMLNNALEDARLQLTLTETQIAERRVTTTQVDIDSAKAALAAAQLQYDRDRRGPTQSEIEEARMNWESARASYLAVQINRDVYCGTPGLQDSDGCKQLEASFGNAYESERNAQAQYQALLEPVSNEKLQQSYASVVQAKARLDGLEQGITPEQDALFKVQLDQARAAVTRAEKNLREAIVLSPCDCVVQEVNVSVGAVPKGVALTLVDLAGLEFKTTNLTERELSNVAVGQPAQIRLRAGDKRLAGRVAAVLPQSVGQQGGAALFTIIVSIDPAGTTNAAINQTLPGMTGVVEIDTQAR
jgi:multidrug resistance efflux pump